MRAVEQRQAFLRRRARSARDPRFASAVGGRQHACRRRTISPTPIIAAAMCASGARSPDAPTEPCAGTTGVRPRVEHRASSRRSSSGRTPEAPCARLASFSAIISRTTATGIGFADTRGMREHDIALELCEIGGGDAHAGEFAEAGVDPIDGLAAARMRATAAALAATLRSMPDRDSRSRRDRSRANGRAGRRRARTIASWPLQRREEAD